MLQVPVFRAGTGTLVKRQTRTEPTNLGGRTFAVALRIPHYAADAGMLSILIHPAATVPDNSATGLPLSQAKDRIDCLVETLAEQRGTIVMPTPALAEFPSLWPADPHPAGPSSRPAPCRTSRASTRGTWLARLMLRRQGA